MLGNQSLKISGFWRYAVLLTEWTLKLEDIIPCQSRAWPVSSFLKLGAYMVTPLIMAVLFLTISLISPFPVVTTLSALIAILSLLDFRGRLKEFHYHLEALIGGHIPLAVLMRICKYSHCQRQSLVLAGDVLGVGDQIRYKYYSMGYRWWHIAPDWLFTKPQIVFTLKFWKVFIGWRL